MHAISLPPTTPRQAEILDFVRIYHREKGFPPTRCNIASHFGFASPNAAEEHLRALEKKGYLQLKPGTARGIVLTNLD